MKKQVLFVAGIFLLAACLPLYDGSFVLPETSTPSAKLFSTLDSHPTASPFLIPTLILTSPVISITITPTFVSNTPTFELTQSVLLSNTIYSNGKDLQIVKFLVSYLPTEWEYIAAEKAYYSLHEPVLVNRKMPDCTLTEKAGRGLPYWVTTEFIGQDLVDVEWQLRKVSLLRETESGRIFTISYSTPVAHIELSVHGVSAENESECINAAENVLRNFEIVYEPIVP